MKKKCGFTLIELMVCIILLAILSSVAAPKFLDLRANARNASLEGVSAQIISQARTVYSKLALVGLEKRNPNRNHPVTGGGYYGDEPANNPFKEICGHDCYFIYGTPSASSTTISSLMHSIGQDQDIVFAGYHSNDWSHEGVTGTNIVATFSFKDNVNIAKHPDGNSLKSESCFIWYSGAREDRNFKIGNVSC